jgi:hypothetical protein
VPQLRNGWHGDVAVTTPVATGTATATAPSAGAPEILHESEGLTIRRNAKNRFTVVTLRYTADPAKRSPEWRTEAHQGMSEPQWQKEYEIEYAALFGEKVFPEIATNRSLIVVAPPHPEIDRAAICWGGFDYGARNPSSFHVYTTVDGVIYSIWELFEPCKNIAEFASKMKACPWWGNIKYIAADPTFMRNKTQQTKAGGLVTVEALFVDEGVTKFVPGNQDEKTWLAIMRDHWKNPVDPTFRIFDCCANQVREFESAVFTSVSDRQAQTTNQYEEMVSKNNHSLDDCKYFMNSMPQATADSAKVRVFDMTKLWRK